MILKRFLSFSACAKLIGLFFVFLCTNGNAQVLTTPQDSLVEVTSIDLNEHSPRKATILSAVLPGAGQIYNKKYWKAPIAWGGMAACIYFIDFNIGEFNRYKNGLIALEDDDPNTINTTGLDAANLNRQIDFYQRWRDISVLSLAGVYVLQIIDANVDAHLFHFDVGEDISLQWTPYSITSAGVKPGVGFSINF